MHLSPMTVIASSCTSSLP